MTKEFKYVIGKKEFFVLSEGRAQRLWVSERRVLCNGPEMAFRPADTAGS